MRDYRADGSGRPAHDPAMMVALLVYAYCVGERSSRRIERRCVEAVAFRVIAANRLPDHTTMSAFSAALRGAVGGVVCAGVGDVPAKAGMVQVGTVAVDGPKMAANAGLDANRTYAVIRAEVKRMLAEADAVDAAEDGSSVIARGDELPARAGGSAAAPRAARIRPSASWRSNTPPGRPSTSGGWPNAPSMRPRRARSSAGGARSRPSRASCETARRNLTDPESRIMNDRGAFVQGYNAQALVGEGRVIVAADVTASGNDSGQLAPMLARPPARTCDAIGDPGAIECVLADGGYWNHDQMRQIGADGTLVAASPPTTRAPASADARAAKAPKPTASKRYSTPRPAGRSTAAAPNSSNRSSRTPNTRARSPASAAAASQQSKPNGT